MRVRRRFHGGFRFVAGFALLSACLVGCGDDERDEAMEEFEMVDTTVIAASGVERIPLGVTAEMVEEGRQLFLPCAVCHGLDGRGNALGPSLRDTVWQHISGSMEEIEAIVRTGVPQPQAYPVPMAPMGGGSFDDQQLHAVAAYVFALSHPGIAPVP